MEYLWIHISSFHVIIGSKVQKDIPVLSSTHGTDGKLISIPEIYWKLYLFPGQEITQNKISLLPSCSVLTIVALMVRFYTFMPESF